MNPRPKGEEIEKETFLFEYSLVSFREVLSFNPTRKQIVLTMRCAHG